jgi:hydroxyethylthiazole kinase-like uncharacterized protein yjeF
MSSDARANANILLADGDHCLRLAAQATAQQRVYFESAQLIVDAMLGTGAKGNLRQPISDWVGWANQTKGALKVAIDIPTGVDATTGQVSKNYFNCDATLTFVARKPAMANRQIDYLFGEVEVLPIGIPEGQIRQCLSWVT